MKTIFEMNPNLDRKCLNFIFTKGRHNTGRSYIFNMVVNGVFTSQFVGTKMLQIIQFTKKLILVLMMIVFKYV